MLPKATPEQTQKNNIQCGIVDMEKKKIKINWLMVEHYSLLLLTVYRIRLALVFQCQLGLVKKTDSTDIS